MKKHLIYLAVIIILLVVVGFNRCSNKQTKTKVTTKTVVDSTSIDSLESVITKLKSVPPETTRVEVPVPQEAETVIVKPDGTKVKEYKSTYTDSIISASWTTGLTGSLRYQNFEYSLHHIPHRIKTVTKTVYRTREVNTTITKNTGGFVSIGGDIGHSLIGLSVGSVKIRYQSKDGYSYYVRYDPLLKGYYIGASIPIRLKQIF